MRYLYTIVFKVRGIVVPAETPAIELVVDSNRDMLAVVSNRPDDLCDQCDWGTGIANLLLTQIFVRNAGLDLTKPDESSDVIAKEVEKVREARKADFGDGPCLVLKIKGSVAAFPLEHTTEYRDFTISLGSSPKALIHQTSRPVITSVITALTMAHAHPITLKKLSDRVVFFSTDGKPVYCYDFTARGHGYVSSAMSRTEVESAGKWYANLVAEPSLEKVCRLLTASLQTDGDMLRAFLSSWTALEIFVNARFSGYERQVFETVDEGNVPGTRRQYVDRIREVMKDKYRLADKFEVISCQLCPSDADKDLADFQKAKKLRDKMTHGDDVTESELPVVIVQNLVRKYLRLHVEHT